MTKKDCYYCVIAARLDQRIHRSVQFDVYALMGGMTLATVSRDSLRFNRMTQLNLLQRPDRIQWFEGPCVEAAQHDGSADK